jgi:hypothetical protein
MYPFRDARLAFGSPIGQMCIMAIATTDSLGCISAVYSRTHRSDEIIIQLNMRKDSDKNCRCPKSIHFVSVYLCIRTFDLFLLARGCLIVSAVHTMFMIYSSSLTKLLRILSFPSMLRNLKTLAAWRGT